MADNRRAIGVREVAQLAGVSRQTVSRVLNGHPSIRPETRTRVQQVIDELGYRPNRVARALGTNSSGTLGVLIAVPRGADYGTATALAAIDAAARSTERMVQSVHLGDVAAGAIRAGVEALLDMMVDGLVVIAPQARTLRVLEDLQPNVPYVFLHSRSGTNPHEIFVDQFAGARAATRHLLELGHRDIVHVTGPQEWTEAEGRMQGYLVEMSDWDATPPQPPILGDWTADTGYAIGQQLAPRLDITAVFAANDATALGIMHALHEAGRQVPGDVSVVGFDDLAQSRHFLPPLTTVRQDFAALGRNAVQRLFDADGEAPTALSMRPQLVVRASTAAPRLAAHGGL